MPLVPAPANNASGGAGLLKQGNTIGVGRPPGLTFKFRESCARDLEKRRVVLNAIIDTFSEYLKEWRKYVKDLNSGKAEWVDDVLIRVQTLAALGGDVKSEDWAALRRALDARPRSPIPLVTPANAIQAVQQLYEMSGMKVTIELNPTLPGMEEDEMDAEARRALLAEVGISG